MYDWWHNDDAGSLSVGTLFMMVDLAMNFITPVVTLFNEFNQVKSTVQCGRKHKKPLIMK